MGPQGPRSEKELGVGTARLPPGSQVQSGARPPLALSSLRPPADLPASEVDGPREHLQQPLHHPERRVVLRDPALGDLHPGYTSSSSSPQPHGTASALTAHIFILVGLWDGLWDRAQKLCFFLVTV